LVLLNPWVHSEAGEGRMRIKHYYLSRFLQKSFWVKLFSGQVRYSSSAGDLFKAIRFLFGKSDNSPSEASGISPGKFTSYIDRMLTGLRLYSGNVLIILSENDLVSQEFIDLSRTGKAWQSACQSSKIEKIIVPEANHTFSSRDWRNQATRLTREWLDKHATVSTLVIANP